MIQVEKANNAIKKYDFVIHLLMMVLYIKMKMRPKDYFSTIYLFVIIGISF